MRAVEVTRAGSVYQRVVDYNEFEDFEGGSGAQVSRALIETADLEGWASSSSIRSIPTRAARRARTSMPCG